MPAPALPTGVTQAEVDDIFARIRATGKTDSDAKMRAQVPAYLTDQWDYVVANPQSTSTAKTAVSVIKATPGTLIGFIVNTVGTGTLTLNDNETTAGSNINNQFYTAAATSFTAGQAVMLNRECNRGIVASAFPTSGNYTFIYT